MRTAILFLLACTIWLAGFICGVLWTANRYQGQLDDLTRRVNAIPVPQEQHP